MKRLVMLTLLLAWPLASVRGQDWPKPTKEGQQVLAELLRTCAGEVALLAGRPPRTVADLVLLQDAARFRVAVATRPKLLGPALRDALVALRVQGQIPPIAPALLETVGNQTRDPLARGFAALFRGVREQSGGRPESALVEYESATALFRIAAAPSWEATVINQAGSIQYASGKLGRALEYFQRALALREKALPAGHPDIATSLNNIAAVYSTRGDHAKALESHQRALALWEKALPPGHPSIATSLNNIANVYCDLGDHAKALEYHQRALALREKALPPGHPAIAQSLNNIANVYRECGDQAKALEYHQRALALREKALPAGHPDIAASVNNIALV